MPAITGIPLWTITVFLLLKDVAGSPFLKDFLSCRGPSLQRISSWRAGWSRALTFSFWFSILLWIVFHNTLLSWSALNFCCPLYAISTVSFSFALRLSLGCSSATSGHLQLSFTRRSASHDVSAAGIGPPCCESGVSLAIHLFWTVS